MQYVGNVNWLMIRSEVILSLSVEGGAGMGSGGEVFDFYISSVVVKWWWWPKIAEWHCIVSSGWGEKYIILFLVHLFCGGQVIAAEL